MCSADSRCFELVVVVCVSSDTDDSITIGKNLVLMALLDFGCPADGQTLQNFFLCNLRVGQASYSRPFQPNLMFEGKDRILPKSGAPHKH